MILDEISYTSEYGLIQDPKYPEVYHIELNNLADRESCPRCTWTLNKKEWKSRTILDYDTTGKHVVIIKMHRQKYHCPKCGKNCFADPEYDSLRHTEAFDRYLALEALKGSEKGKHNTTRGKKWSNTVLAERYGVSRDMVSKAMIKYAPAFTPLLIPFNGYNIFYLFPFQYDRRKRYMMFAVREEGYSMPIAIFGYQDSITEIRTYLDLHQAILEENDFYGTPVFITDFEPELIQMIKDTLKDVEVAIIYKELHDKLESYRPNTKSMDTDSENSINAFLSAVQRKLNSNKVDWEQLENLWRFYTDDDETAREYLQGVWQDINTCKEECLRIHQYSNFKSKTLDEKLHAIQEQVDAFNSNTPVFEVAAAKIMITATKPLYRFGSSLYVYTSSVFTDEREKLVKLNVNNPLQGHTLKDLLDENFDSRSITDIMFEEMTDQYYDGIYDDYEASEKDYEEYLDEQQAFQEFIEENPDWLE